MPKSRLISRMPASVAGQPSSGAGEQAAYLEAISALVPGADDRTQLLPIAYTARSTAWGAPPRRR